MRGDFEGTVYPIPPVFQSQKFRDILALLPMHAKRFESFRDSTRNDFGYQFSNGFFKSPDAEVLYTLVRQARPRQIIEIGCGNSTRVIRQAILDETLSCHHQCIDPEPRVEISNMANFVVRKAVETLDHKEITQNLSAGDILFIDTTHEVTPANDVAYIYGRVLPEVPGGVIVHIHDIFLPFEYPLSWVKDDGLNWGEQYIVQAMLMESSRWEVLWPGHYLQRTLPDFDSYFPNRSDGNAQSLWLRASTAAFEETLMLGNSVEGKRFRRRDLIPLRLGWARGVSIFSWSALPRFWAQGSNSEMGRLS